MTAAVTFYFDLGSPYAYLTAERLPSLIAQPVRWQPVLLGGLFRLTGRSSWALGDSARRRAGMAEIERRARRYGMPPMRWPDSWPGDYLFLMRAATYAFSVGRGREFSQLAFREAFRAGCELSVSADVLRVGEAAGLDAAQLQSATTDPQIKLALREATSAAHELGVFGVPTIAVDGELFWGDDRLEDAAARVGRVRASRSAPPASEDPSRSSE
jgi:2-hydroxychromene-2-carboxylate isomerase